MHIAIELNDIICLVLERLPVQELQKCLLLNKKWNHLAQVTIRKRLLSKCPKRQLPRFIGTERTELDMLKKYEQFAGFGKARYSALQHIWSSPIQKLSKAESITNGKLISNDRNITFVSEFQLDQEYYVKPTLLQNNQIVVFIEALDEDDCISMFLVDPFENTMKLLPWKLYNHSILINSLNAKWYICSNFEGETYLYDPVSLECAVYNTRPGAGELIVRGNYLVTQSSTLISSIGDSPNNRINVYRLPEKSVYSGLEELWSFECGEERYFDLNDQFLATYEPKEVGLSTVEIYNLEDGTLYHKFPFPEASTNMFVSSFSLTRFHCLFYEREYFPAPTNTLPHKVTIFDLQNPSGHHTLEIKVEEDAASTLMAVELSFDESGIVAKTDENQLLLSTFNGSKYMAEIADSYDTLGFWICLSGMPTYWRLPLAASEIFRPMVNALPRTGNSQTLKILSHRDGCFQATHPLKPGAYKGDPSGYYEFEVKRNGRENSALVIGLAQAGYSSHLLPGWRYKSAGYHSDDGLVFINDGEFGQIGSRPFSTGDVVGIGYSVIVGSDLPGRSIEYCFYLNGDLLDTTLLDEFTVSEDLYPCIGADGDFEITVNFHSSYEGYFESSPFL